MKKIKKFLTGFTLIEILITIAIFALVVTLVFNIYFLSQKFYLQGETKAELLQNGRIILERVTRDIRQSSELVTALPQIPDSPDNPPPSEIEFQDGHTPSPYDYLGSTYYYIRYGLSTSTGEMRRQYRVYCFDDCATCANYFRWNDTQLVEGEPVPTHPCDLEDRVVGEYVLNAQFWGAGLINVSLALTKGNEQLDFKTEIFGRNL